MLDTTQIAQFQADGFLLSARVVDNDMVERLRGELDRVINDQDKPGVPQPVRLSNLGGDAEAPVWQIVNIWRASDAYHQLIELPTIIEEVQQLTNARELRVWHDQIQYKPAKTGGVNMWHQDGPLWRILQPKTLVSAWIALDDVDQSNGCMSMVPGSHTWGDNNQQFQAMPDFDGLPTEFQGRRVEPRRCPVPKGCVHYHHSLTWHGSHTNTSGQPRRAIAIHYMTEQTCYFANDTHVMKQYVQVQDGAKLEGEHFPLVWDESFAAREKKGAARLNG